MVQLKEKNVLLKKGLYVAIPLIVSLLFFIVKEFRPVVDIWVFQILTPISQFIGRCCAIIPFAVGEAVIFLAIAFGIFLFLLSIYFGISKKSWQTFIQGIFPILITGLWTIAAVNWMWNITYYATGFTERSGLDVSPYSVEELYAVTEYFAQKAGEYSTYPERTEDGFFAETQEDIFSSGVFVYEHLAQEFPSLAKNDVQAKPLLCSEFQSILGFTGIYCPFTGEANVNIVSPAPFLPATIAHEMAHQRLIASEQEANFIGITASVTSDDVVYQYSGYLLGLTQLSNALYPVDPDGWQRIVEKYFTTELATDWNENWAYWNNLESPVEEVAEAAYDSFLKGNGQELGMQSYGACVDLLVAYFSPYTVN